MTAPWPEGSQQQTGQVMPAGQRVNGQSPPFLLTTARWLNRKRRVRDPYPKGGESGYYDKWSKVLAHTGPYEQFAYGTDTPSDWRGPLQRCLICSQQSGLIAVDVDDEEAFSATRTGQLTGRQHAISMRNEPNGNVRFHIAIDARGVPEADWPRQGPIAGGDIKSKGFIPLPGCIHYSGDLYEPVRQPGPVPGTPELIAAINADLADQRESRRDSNGNGGEGGGHDGGVAAAVLSMVLRGLDKDECYAEWVKIAVPHDPDWPFTDDDFERHYRGAVRKAEQIRAEEIQVDPADVAQLAAMNEAQKPVQGVVVARPKVVTREGLLTVKAARWVMGQGPLCYGLDNQLWAYQHGVWLPGEDPAYDIVHARIAWLLGDKFRQAHSTNIKEMIRAQVGVLRCDPVPGLINFRNGLLPWQEQAEDLHSLPLRPHDPGVFSTVQLAAGWNPVAVCPAFDAFLAGALAPEDVPRMWEMIGYLMMSGNPLHKIFLLFGRGFNGKGVLLRVLTALLGEASVSSVSLHSLADERFTRVNLLGKLANICGDIDATYIERTGLLKQLTGEDLITAEHKFRKPAQFTSWAVPVFSANEMPTSSDTSLGWQKRWEVFTFPNTFPHNPGLEAGLRQLGELEGIAVAGVRALRELMGRTPPEFSHTDTGDAAKAEFVASQNPLHGWMAECCWVLDSQRCWSDRRTAYSSYRDWCADGGVRHPLGKQKFYALCKERFGEATHRGWPGYPGLWLMNGYSEGQGPAVGG